MSNLSAVLATAAVGLGRAIQINRRLSDSAALARLTGAFVLTLAALVPGRRRTAWAVSPLVTIVVLAAGLAWQYWTLLTARPAMFVRLRRTWHDPVFFGMLLTAALLTAGVVAGTRPLGRSRSCSCCRCTSHWAAGSCVHPRIRASTW